MILSIDQGTTGTTVFIFDHQGVVVAKAANEFTQFYPEPSWVEHDPEEIWQVTLKTIQQALQKANLTAQQLTAIGITNQRETTILWDKNTGKPIHNAIVWQCRRSTSICENIKADRKEDWFNEKTGLVVDAYFSASKIKWLFDNVPSAKILAKQGRLAFGTIDSWLIWKLTEGSSHVTDHTNASRTMLYNIHTQSWDNDLIDYFGLPSIDSAQSILPSIQNSASYFGKTAKNAFFNAQIPITGVAGDQQSALFGRQCIQKGQVKNTYGTGCFLLMYIGDQIAKSKTTNSGLLTTIACNQQGKPAYAFEGSVFNAGAAIQWLRDELEFISSAAESEIIAESIKDSKNVYVVPAFTGLGAPYWNMNARGTIVGLTRGSGKKEIVRATLESIAYQTKDVMDLMAQESQIEIKSLRVDGGACRNDFLMQFQSDLLNIDIHRPSQIESTVIGAALLAGIGANIWQADKLPQFLTASDTIFRSKMEQQCRVTHLAGWQKAIRQTQIN